MKYIHLVNKGIILKSSEDWLLIRDYLEEAGYYLAPNRFVAFSDRFVHRPHDLALMIPPANAGIAVLEHSSVHEHYVVVKIYTEDSIPETAMTAERFVERAKGDDQWFGYAN